jgi:hypothetical protein
MLIDQSEKEAIIDYLKLSRKASQTGKRELVENIPTDDKKEIARIFKRLRDLGIICYMTRSDELVTKKINHFPMDYNWDDQNEFARPEFNADKCQKKCHGCEQLEHCEIRMKEWVKHITKLALRKRQHPEGQIMAQEIIDHMANKFMGGI